MIPGWTPRLGLIPLLVLGCANGSAWSAGQDASKTQGERVARTDGGGRELHVVGIHVGFQKSDGKIHGGKAVVRISRPGKRVTLALSAYNSS
jgi:hypothetical protein